MKKFLLALSAPVLVLGLQTPALAAPTIPDNLPIFSGQDVAENPQVSVTDEQGNPITRPVQRGDVLIVHGTGFNAEANKGGFPFPVPAGQPNGVYVLYGAFPDQWRPSEGAPGNTRTHPHDRMSWVISDAALAQVPQAPLNMQRTISRVSDPMAADGSFTARIVVDPPAETTGDNWGVYVYPAAGSINAAEEIYIPLAYDPTPGPNTPAEPTVDLSTDASPWAQVADAAGGSLQATDGALLDDANTLSFSRLPDQGDGIIRFQGTASSTARFALAATALKDPWLTPQGDGSWIVSVDASTAVGEGTDSMQRIDVGRVYGTTGVQDLYVGPIVTTQVTFPA
ncbi:MAG: HtaA protein [Corynebacterium sp.]|nr:HtaA protein [Corynebacterium sp.]